MAPSCSILLHIRASNFFKIWTCVSVKTTETKTTKNGPAAFRRCPLLLLSSVLPSAGQVKHRHYIYGVKYHNLLLLLLVFILTFKVHIRHLLCWSVDQKCIGYLSEREKKRKRKEKKQVSQSMRSFFFFFLVLWRLATQLKEIVHSKMKILSLITHPHVVSNPWDLCFVCKENKNSAILENIQTQKSVRSFRPAIFSKMALHWHRGDELLNKVIIFVFFAHKKYSPSFVKLQLNPWWLLWTWFF